MMWEGHVSTDFRGWGLSVWGTTDWVTRVCVRRLDSLSLSVHSSGECFGVVVVVFKRVESDDPLNVCGDHT